MIKVEAVDISNISNIFPGSAFFWHFLPNANSQLPLMHCHLLKKLQTLLIEYISGEGSGINRFSSFFDIAFDNIRLGPVPKFLEQKELE